MKDYDTGRFFEYLICIRIAGESEKLPARCFYIC